MYYRTLGNGFLFDTYGILGSGKVKNYFSTSQNSKENRLEANVFRIAVRSGIGFISNYFEASFNPGIGLLSYNNITGNLIFDGEDQIKYLEDRSSNFMIEPTLTLRGGAKNLKLQLQMGKSFNISHSDFKMDDLLLTIGLNYRIF